MSQVPANESQEQWRKIVHEDDATVLSHWRNLVRRFRKMPRWVRIVALALLLIAALVVVYALARPASAQLQLICHHNFRSAQLTVMVDGELAYSRTLTTPPKKRADSAAKGTASTESFSKVISVPTGLHSVQVRISAPAEGFDQERNAATNFTPEKESILVINSTKRSSLAVNFEGTMPAVKAAAAESDPRTIPRSGATILLSILGTMLSASISFLVQEFWRSHKNRAASS